MAENELIVEQIQIGPMANFTYIIGSRSTREVAVVDPAWDIDGLLAHIDEQEYTLTAALATHYHPDHIGGGMGGRSVAGVVELLEQRPVKIYTHRSEADGVKKVTGVSETDLARVDSGDRLAIGPVEVEFLHTPATPPARSASASATPLSLGIPCSSTVAAAWTCPAPTLNRCITACKSSRRCRTTRCFCPVTTTAPSPTPPWGRPRNTTPTSP